jgi:hypothetical protein
VRKNTLRKVIVMTVDDLQAMLADCATRIMEINSVLVGGGHDFELISQRLEIVRAQLAAIDAKNTELRCAYAPGNRRIPAEMRWLVSHCSRFIAAQVSALVCSADVLTMTGGAEGEDLEYLRMKDKYFVGVYVEYRRLTALALSNESGAYPGVDADHMMEVEAGLSDFYREVKQFDEFREVLIERW